MLVAVKCPALIANNSNATNVPNQIYLNTVQVRCDTGYEIPGHAEGYQAACGPVGKWTPQIHCQSKQYTSK